MMSAEAAKKYLNAIMELICCVCSLCFILLCCMCLDAEGVAECEGKSICGKLADGDHSILCS